MKAISTLFSGKKNEDLKKIAEDTLPEYKGKIEIDKYMEIDYTRVQNSDAYLFRTPNEVLKILNKKMVLWIDEKNNLLGLSDTQKSKLFILSDIQGLEIQNMLPAKGEGGSFLSVRLSNSKSFEISEAGVYTFDEYADDIVKTTGLTVIFAKEYYNC
ncbi:hypothetical protein [Chryseobacterium sp. M5A1_1a]